MSGEGRELHVKIAACEEDCVFFSADGSRLIAAMGSVSGGKKGCFLI